MRLRKMAAKPVAKISLSVVLIYIVLVKGMTFSPILSPNKSSRLFGKYKQVEHTIFSPTPSPNEPSRLWGTHQQHEHTYMTTSPVSNAQDTSGKKSTPPCTITSDTDYGGLLVNCSSLGLREIRQEWFHGINITTLILDNNSLTVIQNCTFSNLPSLRNLSIRASNVGFLQVDSLHGLENLISLNLERNNLMDLNSGIPPNKRPLPPGLFVNVRNLHHLFMAYNIKEGNKCNNNFTCIHSQHTDLFAYLHNLKSLSIDGVPDSVGRLYLGQAFKNLTRLTYLKLYCPLITEVHSYSLIGLKEMQLKELYLDYFHPEIKIFHQDTFQYVQDLTSLSIKYCRIGNHNILKALWPFQNKTLEVLYLHNTKNLWYEPPVPTFKDQTIDNKIGANLSRICVRHFSWTDSALLAIHPDVLTSHVWLKCACSIDLSNNDFWIAGWTFLSYKISMFQKVRLFIFGSAPRFYDELNVRSHFNDRPRYETISDQSNPIADHRSFSRDANSGGNNIYPKDVDFEEPRYKNSFSSSDNISSSEKDEHLAKSIGNNSKMNTITPEISNRITQHSKQRTSFLQKGQPGLGEREMSSTADQKTFQNSSYSNIDFDIFKFLRTNVFVNNATIILRLPKTLEILMGYHSIICNNDFGDINIELVDAESLRALFYNNPDNTLHMRGTISGLEKMQILDLSTTYLDVADYVFDNMPALRGLYLHGMQPADFFVLHSIKRLLRNLTMLKRLDISSNGLNMLPSGTFESNPQLTHVNLADNRFSRIPFDLNLTPNSVVLDLSRNSITYLDDEEMAMLSRHAARVQEFTLILAGNSLACLCSQIEFLAWLNSTTVKLDFGDKYSCVSDNGNFTYIADITTNIPAFWRQCQGKELFFLALILAVLMIVVFLVAYLVTRFQNALLAFVFRLFFRAFRPKGPYDYNTHVFIGYADKDYQFIMNKLNIYLEEILGLSTFVHQRDFTDSRYPGEQFYEVIQDSWRVLLVLSENFLHRYDMAHTVMKFAALSVTPINQHRVLVLVEESQVNQIPDYLHGVLDDANIITITDLKDDLDYERTQKLKECLRWT